MISVYKRKINNNMTIRDEDAIKRYVALIQWGRTHPVQFIELVLGIPLMDYQRWLVSESWFREYVVWVCSRNAGKSFLVGCFVMARNILFPKLQTQIISSGNRQANETFETMEKIAKGNIKTLITENSVFVDEVIKTKADSDGFTHDPKKGNACSLMNGSSIKAVTGTPKTIRGKRSNCNIYDEAGTISREMYDVTEPFMGQDSAFKMGSSYDPDVYPKEIPNIRLYIGSASDTNSLFYEKYKDGMKQMLAGNNKYFVADLNCETPKNPTRNGIKMPALLSQSEIDRKMRENEIIGMREYYNIFDHFDLEDSVVSRNDIYNNTENFVPSLGWGGKKHKYVITFDPASKNDNSPVLVTDIFKNEDGEICGRFVHMENLVVRYKDGSKRPMRLDEQANRLREMIYEYNGRENTNPYNNVVVLMDAGTGGQAPALAQELCKDWCDSKGKKHFGIYDEESEDMKRWSEAYPHAIPGVLKLIEPRKYRNDLFESTKTMVASGYIKFPPTCPKYDMLVLDDGTERRLSKSEQESLIQMDLMKEEMASMVRSKSPKGVVTYQLPPEKRNKMHDDRNYVAIMACWWINQIRNDEVLSDKVAIDFSVMLGGSNNMDRSASDPWVQTIRRHSVNKVNSPFQGSSPFSRR